MAHFFVLLRDLYLFRNPKKVKKKKTLCKNILYFNGLFAFCKYCFKSVLKQVQIVILNLWRFDFHSHSWNQISNQIAIFQCDLKNCKIVQKWFKIRFCKIVNQIVEYPGMSVLAIKTLARWIRVLIFGVQDPGGPNPGLYSRDPCLEGRGEHEQDWAAWKGHSCPECVREQGDPHQGIFGQTRWSVDWRQGSDLTTIIFPCSFCLTAKLTPKA
jgi:hypothetical protein